VQALAMECTGQLCVRVGARRCEELLLHALYPLLERLSDVRPLAVSWCFGALAQTNRFAWTVFASSDGGGVVSWAGQSCQLSAGASVWLLTVPDLALHVRT
jgi:hypothetical protein